VSGDILTVGTFDGVHLGHQAVLEEIARRATASGGRSVLVTFEPHPMEVVNPLAAPLLLTTAAEKRAVLVESPVDHVAFLPFTPALAELPPERFVREELERRFDLAELVIGYDHGFGRGRTGGVELLRRIGREDGFAVDVVAAVVRDGRPVSSTQIRRAVAGGDLDTARECLGRFYSVTGEVVRGAGRGRGLGVPTLNLAPPPPRKLLPPDGVYAARVAWRGERRGAMLNLGPRPTFGEAARTLEAHLFDFEGDLVGETVTVEFVRRLRDVMRFASAESLRNQLDRDRVDALRALTEVGRSVNL
jgi:riboflavin kinase / FMN adenylyltransferase